MGFIINPYVFAAATDADADAFISAAGITDSTQQSAIQTLVTDLKGYGLWTKMKALYPFVGGTATTHKYNLKDPQDTDGAFRLVFSGGWTHSSTGALPNGTNAYADTFYNQTTVGDSLNSAHLSYYSRTNTNGTEVEIGVQEPGGNYNLLEIRTSGTTYFLQNQSSLTSASDSDSRGFYLGNRQASNDIDGWRQGVKIINATTASNALPNGKIYLGAMNNAVFTSILYYSTKECAFASIGDGLTDTEASNFYTAVQAFQTTLSRNV